MSNNNSNSNGTSLIALIILILLTFILILGFLNMNLSYYYISRMLNSHDIVLFFRLFGEYIVALFTRTFA